MTWRLALRSLVSRPVRSAVLTCGFGAGIAVMAVLLGVGEVIVDQAQSPALAGGGDVRVSGLGGRVTSAKWVLSQAFGSPPFTDTIAAASPTREATLYLVTEDGTLPVTARGGIPSLERAVGDPETTAVDAWVDASADAAWTSPDPADLLRDLDRFHPVPDAPRWRDSWAEWLYFNGTAGNTKFYLTFLVGPEGSPGVHRAGVRLQLERDGRATSYTVADDIDEDTLLTAPDIAIAGNSVRLDGLRYVISLDLTEGDVGRPLRGEIVLDAAGARSIPPFTIRGAEGWQSGYVVPVPAGRLSGELRGPGWTASLDGGTGYHDHNWGFWEGVTWRWGQVADGDLSIVYGRVLPPEEAADPRRLPGFLAVLGPEGPLGFSTDVRIVTHEAPGDAHPERIVIEARGESLDIDMDLEVLDATVTRRERLPGEAEPVDFLQMRVRYRVEGEIGGRPLEFTALGAAETFRSILSPQ